MPDNINLVELADEIAEIARTTTDPTTGARLMALIERLMGEAGLSGDDDDGAGGGDLPTGWVSEPVCCPA